MYIADSTMKRMSARRSSVRAARSTSSPVISGMTRSSTTAANGWARSSDRPSSPERRARDVVAGGFYEAADALALDRIILDQQHGPGGVRHVETVGPRAAVSASTGRRRLRPDGLRRRRGLACLAWLLSPRGPSAI